ncbi:uncharacterized protein [Solanum tuberosum]|uniref:uncharacterized protein n=1 Tax=Solanum tuberosum TaxID=4113 RepID=UPI00073A2BCE|nr:PREDICTED: uncharacterized protein LOC107059551 [Solanum tuberosum]
MEPLQDPLELDQYKVKLGFDKALVNRSGKIWIFWRDDWEGTIVMDSLQQITMRFCRNDSYYIIFSVYARCSAIVRLELWAELEGSAENSQVSWIVGGDFNVSLCAEEKLGGLAFIQHEAIDFSQCINNCASAELDVIGSKYSWWNGRIEEEGILKRLDRVLKNNVFQEAFPSTVVHHLIRQGSDMLCYI